MPKNPEQRKIQRVRSSLVTKSKIFLLALEATLVGKSMDQGFEGWDDDDDDDDDVRIFKLASFKGGPNKLCFFENMSYFPKNPLDYNTTSWGSCVTFCWDAWDGGMISARQVADSKLSDTAARRLLCSWMPADVGDVQAVS